MRMRWKRCDFEINPFECLRIQGAFRFGDALWYLVITASTVGYGDFFPVTDGGKIFAIFYLSSKISFT